MRTAVLRAERAIRQAGSDREVAGGGMSGVRRARPVLQRSVGHLRHLFGLFALGLRLDLVHLLHRLEHLKEQAKGKQASPGEGMGGCDELAGERMQE